MIDHRRYPTSPKGKYSSLGHPEGVLHFIVLENTTSRHAFWRAWVEENSNGYDLVIQWGGIGKSAQEKRTAFNGQWTAKAQLDNKVANKLKRGYSTMTPISPSNTFSKVKLST